MQYNGRVDANLTSKDRLAFTIYWVPQDTTQYQGTNRPENLWHHSQINDAFSVVWDRTISSTMINQARANAAGWRFNEVASNPQEPFGLPSDYIDATGTANPAFFGANGPGEYDQWTYEYSDTLTKVWGRHNIKVGGEFNRLYYLNAAIYASRPSFNFHNIWDFLNDAPYNENGTFNPTTGVPEGNREDNRENLWGIFVQDDFKLRRNLTINLGLRYSYFGPMYSTENNLDVLQFGQGSSLLTGMGVKVGGNLWSAPKGDIGPMIGFAWQPDSNLVIRGGAGIAYNQDEIAITANGFGNPPNVVSPGFFCNTVANPTCAGTGILYQTASSPTSIFGYPANPAAITTFGSNNLPTTGPFGIVGYPSSPKSPVVYHYSLDVQYQFPGNNVMSLGYQGNVSRHLLTNEIFNVVAGAAGFAQNPLINNINYWDNNGKGSYNALVSSLSHNFSHQFQATAQYTWSKALDDTSGPYERDPYPFDVNAAYGPSDYNVTQAFKVFALWQPVIFHGSNNWAEKIVGGWSLSGIWNVHTGFPWNPTYGVQGPNGLYYGGAGYYNLRPATVLQNYGNSTSNSVFEGHTNPNFNGDPNAYFIAPTYAEGANFPGFGALPIPGIGRNSMVGPSYNDLDISLTKAFGIPNNKILGEGARLEFRVDAYNVFNKTNLNTETMNTFLGTVNPDGSLASTNPAFGTVGNALGARVVQLQARFSF